MTVKAIVTTQLEDIDMDTQKLAESIKRVMELYEAMVAEGKLIAEDRNAILGGWEPDISRYVTLTDYRPARTAWKAAQGDMANIIRQQSEVIRELREALDEQHHRVENLLIAEGMGWDMEGVLKELAKTGPATALALALSAPLVKKEGE
jgi:hypothetical protein